MQAYDSEVRVPKQGSRLKGLKVIQTRGYGMQQVLSDGKKLFRSRIYPVRQFNRIVAVYQGLKASKKKCIVHLRLARYISPSYGIILTPFYPRLTFKWARENTKLFMYGVLQALVTCHDRAIVHRNINWRSVQRVPRDLITKEQCEVQLTGFKYAVSEHDPAFRRPVGLIHFRAPEAQGKSVPMDAGPAIDMWSVGMLFLGIVSQLFSIAAVLTSSQLLNRKNYYFIGDPEYTREYIAGLKDETIECLSQRVEDETARDLLQQLLRIDYRKRVKAGDALLHRYFVNSQL